MIIAITGTPGTGKSTLAKKLAKKLKWKRLDLHYYYKNISSGYNKKKKCYDIDLKKFKELVKSKQENLIIDSHISHLLPKLDLCVVLTCSNLKELGKRLKKRKYSQKKITENLQAEIFQVCLLEAKKKKHKVVVFDTSKKKDFVKEIICKLKN